jgi:D-glycero-beta-D-manno-heptose 1-phosphate adenylyltransferase
MPGVPPDPAVRDCVNGSNSTNRKAFNCRLKIVALADLPAWRAARRDSGARVVATNGCFDLLHAGHVTYLEAARNLGDALVVGLNGDASVRALKGPDRPLNPEGDRATVLAALECVDAVCVFPETRAAHFLSLALPDVYVKGGDYTLDTLDAEERRIVEDAGGNIILVPMVPGKSTTALRTKMTLAGIDAAEAKPPPRGPADPS